MEASGANSDAQRGISSSSTNSRRHGVQLSAANLFRSPLSTLLEYSGILRTRSSNPESDSLVNRVDDAGASASPASAGGSGEVTIRIVGAGEQEHDRVGTTVLPSPAVASLREADGQNEALESQLGDRGTGDVVSQQLNGNTDMGSTEGAGINNRESSYQRYDIQQAARWIEQIIPFSLLLLIVFIRQHLQGFFVTILIAAVMFKSNDIVKKQTALKGERKISVLIGICLLFSGYVIGFYWWYRNDNLLSPLLMLPPKAIPPFWHAIFVIMVNDTLVRQAAMVFKCFLLIYYKNSRGRNYRKQVQSFFTATKALSRKEIHYGVYATSEQVNAAGDLCAICQEKMHTPILLRCKHIFCEDCVSEWFERERTCPLCRSLVKPADLKSFGDGSTSLFFQLF
ncbi:unnamed protein product [Withania somnifera]